MFRDVILHFTSYTCLTWNRSRVSLHDTWTRGCADQQPIVPHPFHITKKESTKEEEKDQQTQKSWWQKFRYFLGIMTIEPMMIVQGIASNIVAVPQDQMILYKVCREKQFNLTQDFCANIEDYRNTTAYHDVEQEVVSFKAIISWTEHLVPILLSFYIGSWSDHFGRKPFLALCMAGKMAAAFCNLLNAIFLDQWSRWVWLATVMPIQNISGGYLTFIMMTYSFIADNSTQRERMARLGFASLMWAVSQPISYPFGSLLFDSGGYICVFSTSLLLFCTASAMGLIRLWGFKEKIEKKETSLKGLLSPRHVTDSFKTTYKKRDDHKRYILVSMMLTMLSTIMQRDAEAQCQYMYTKRAFGWEVKDYSNFIMVHSGVYSAGMILLTPLMHHFNVNDNLIILLSSVSGIAGQLMRAFAKNPTVFYASVAVELASNMFSPPIRAQMTRCILPEETGKVFAMLASLECFVPIISATLFTNVYNATIELKYPWNGTFYFGAIGFTLIGLFATIAVYIVLKGRMVTPASEENVSKYQRMNSNLNPDDVLSRKAEILCVALRRTEFYL